MDLTSCTIASHTFETKLVIQLTLYTPHKGKRKKTTESKAKKIRKLPSLCCLTTILNSFNVCSSSMVRTLCIRSQNRRGLASSTSILCQKCMSQLAGQVSTSSLMYLFYSMSEMPSMWKMLMTIVRWLLIQLIWIQTRSRSW